jgi:hypothetical protein
MGSTGGGSRAPVQNLNDDEADGDAEGRRGLQYARHPRQSVFSYDARTISFFAEFTT